MPKYTLITGASSGIGYELSKVFAHNGHNLLLVARREARLKEQCVQLSNSFNIQALYFPCDLTSEVEIEKLFDFIRTHSLQINYLVNNAGVGHFSLFEQSDPAKNNHLLALNIKAVISLTHRLLPNLKNNSPSAILNISSMAAWMPGPYIAVYAATKSFVLSFSQSLASELEDKDVQVSVLCPADVVTEFQKHANLENFEIKESISVHELAEYTYQQFVLEHKLLIIPPDAQKKIDSMTRSGSAEVISRNLYKIRKLLANKLGIN